MRYWRPVIIHDEFADTAVVDMSKVAAIVNEIRLNLKSGDILFVKSTPMIGADR